MEKKKIILIVILVVFLGIAIGFFLTSNKKTNNNVNDNNSNSNSNSKDNTSNNSELISSYESGTTIVSFYKNGNIVVSDNSGNGTGKMENYGEVSLNPWNAFTLGVSMKKLIIEKGVLNLGDNAFNSFNLEKIEWSDDLERIGDANFPRMYNLELPTLPANLKEIGKTVFAQDFKDDVNNTLVIPKNCTVIGNGTFYNTGIHHFIIEAETLTVGKENESGTFWIGCKHDITIEVKNESVKQAILNNLVDDDNGRIKVIVKSN